jgi:hypothetical protein
VQPRWRNDGKELFYRTLDGNLMAVDIRSGTSIESGIPKALFVAPLNAALQSSTFDYAVTADGQKFLISSDVRGEVAEPMTAILNWTWLLKK